MVSNNNNGGPGGGYNTMPELEGYRELSDKVNQLDIKLTERLGQVEQRMAETMSQTKMDLTAGISDIKVTIAQLNTKLEGFETMRAEVAATSERSREAHNKANEAAKDVQDLESEVRPIINANLIERTSKMESKFWWVITAIVGFFLTLLGFIVQQIITVG